MRNDGSFQVEKQLQAISSVSELVAQGFTPAELVHSIFSPAQVHLYPPMDLKFKCHCSKAGVARMRATMGPAELEEMVKAGEDVQITCEYCRIRYEFTPDEIRQISETLQERSH
ncbi:MAG: Hsp33 family molecular chaperone HslO [Desulfuromonadaceae bacterium]